MSLWEYKVITSGKGGFATPALLEKFLNDLGRDEWEIIHFQTPPDNFLAFTGLVRRSTQRDWTLEDAAAAAAKVEAEKLRAEFEAKFKAAATTAPAAAEDRSSPFLEEKVAPDDGFRKPVDTSRDDDPEAQDDDKGDEWDKLTAAEEDELPTFFEAIKPHMRRNQRGPGMSVGVDYLAKKWDQSEDDLKGALAECGFVVPADEDDKAEYVEYDGDLYWLNINRRGELWINTKEKPRPVFRSVKAARIEVETPAPTPKPERQDSGNRRQESERRQESGDRGQDRGNRKPETGDRTPESGEQKAEADDRRLEDKEAAPGAEPQTPNSKPQTQSAPLPDGVELLNKIRPHMRRNRRGPGGSGSTTFLSRALRTNEADLKTAFVALGLTMPATPGDKPVYSEFGDEVWWLNIDSRGGLWVNGREKNDGESLTPNGDSAAEPAVEFGAAAAAVDTVPTPEVAPSVAVESAPAETAVATVDHHDQGTMAVAPVPDGQPAAEPAPAADPSPGNPVVAAIRLLLKETKTGSVAGKVDRVAEELGKSQDDFLGTLAEVGFKVPEKPREKPVFVEHAGEILWLNRNAKGELWLNAKSSKYADKSADAEDSDGSEPSEGGEGEGEKKARRPARPRAKKGE
jgi:hypothetical protein